MPSLKRGLFEALVTAELEASLASCDESLEVERSALRVADASDRIALFISQLTRRAVDGMSDEHRVESGAKLAAALVARIGELVASFDHAGSTPIEPASVLRSIRRRMPDGTPEQISGPLIPLLDTTLLTNAPGEPRVGRQLVEEIQSADRIDVVVAFIRRSGIRPMLGALRTHCQGGRELRVLTTTYTGSTELSALEALREVGAQVRVSYDTSTTRLHAKAWLFHRDSGYSTAYIGSSNLTHSAQETGLEWNVRASGARNPDVLDKVSAVFESYWSGGDFRDFDPTEFREQARSEADEGTQVLLSPIEVRLEPFQERLLEQIQLSRETGHHRNLLVSATGTGKTVMAAVDYARLRQKLRRSRLLLVAHREEILEQSLSTFRHVLREHGFGEKWVGRAKPDRFEHVFASIQSLAATGLANLPADHFDVVIVDEFHHAAAPSYLTLLEHVRPVELLGLTATPERADGLPLLHWFEGRIAAELRLWDAIDQHRLVPFVYFGIHDGADLREVPWHRGRGYDVEGLTKIYTSNDAWARVVVKQVIDHVSDVSTIRALGFCVGVEHARFMARVFTAAGIKSVAVWGDTAAEERRTTLRDLSERRINVVFSVDLFNEGVDVPQIDTLLMLRPTESPTLFLQQLGRGLRRSQGKSLCTVLDFVGQHRKEFRFDLRFQALLGGSRSDVKRQIEQGFPFLPSGCHMELDPVASEVVLRSIREAIPSQWTSKVAELRNLAAVDATPTLARYLAETGRALEDVYAAKGWSDLVEAAGLSINSAGPHESVGRKAVGRLLHVDDVERIAGWKAFLAEGRDLRVDGRERTNRLLRMLAASLFNSEFDKETTLAAAISTLAAHPQIRVELLQLLDVLADQMQHVQIALARHPHVPLHVHARYTRIEILAGFGVGAGARVRDWREGVLWAEEEKADLLAFTLDKTSGEFSPTTRYRDYAISRELIHWESQSMTPADGPIGRRYREHAARGSSVMLFARLNRDDRAFWFLGPATYMSHKGEKPMAITWKLEYPLPGDLFAKFAAAVA